MQTVKIFRPLIVSLSMIAALACGYYYFYHNRDNNNEITVHGNVDIRQVDLGFRVSGRLLEVLFEEGDHVKMGDLIAKLDPVPYEQDLNNLKAQMEQAQANLVKLRAGNRPQEIQEAKAQLHEKEVAHENSRKTYERQSELVKKNYASKQAYDDAYAATNEAKAQLKSAQEALKLSLEGFRQEDIAAGQAQFEAATAQYHRAQTNLNDTVLYAPSDGIILTRIREPGSILNIGNAVYTLSLTNPIWVRAYISEVDLGRVKPGMRTLIYTDSQSTPFEGQIGFISPQAEFTPKNIETKELRTDLVYRLRIVVEDPEGKLRQGMPVTVVIKLAQDNTVKTPNSIPLKSKI